MALTRLAKECRICPYVKNCKHKKMEALGEIPYPIIAETSEYSKADVAAPILRESVNIIVNGERVKIYKDEIEKELHKNLCSYLGLNSAT